VPGQHQDRAFHPELAHPAAQLAPVRIRQPDVKDHKVIKALLCLFHAIGTRSGLEHVEILGHHQLFAQCFAQVIVVIDKQDFA
jgi:hypothetical protein